jgi:hypothetical protein
MKALAELVIATFDLFEAEGRALRHGTFRLGLALALLLLALGLGLGGAALLVWGFYLYLVSWTSAQAAPVLAGLAALVATGVLLWIAWKTVR